MNITFLLGNGFDIGLGLRTKYEDFYKIYADSDNEKDNTNIKGFKKMLSERHNDEKKKIIDWADFEKAFGEHSIEFTTESKNDYIERFEDFVIAFNEYLEKEDKKADYTNTKELGDVMKKAVTTYFHILEGDKLSIQALYNKNSTGRTYNFISFNYTQTVDKCAAALKTAIAQESSRSVGQVLHVHGYIEENMIMGVNDPSQITNNDLSNDIDIIREIVKPQQNKDTKSTYDAKVHNLISSSDIICIYGMSIGDTDKIWWLDIIQWLKGSSNRALVILKHDDKYNPRFTFKKREAMDPVRDNFLSYAEESEDMKNKLAQQIFIGINNNVFQHSLCPKEEVIVLDGGNAEGH